MHKAAYKRYTRIQKLLETDTEYLWLDSKRQMQEENYYAAVRALSPQQRAVITEYIGICAEMAERAIEIACFCDENEKGSG